ncbi:MAG TPA: endolytic transglycosylase MltG [Lapillicoccus sp.]|nr:endolytic transglycosylase MltG [Lapillicoccus sp.]
MTDRRDLASGHDHVVFGSVADDPYEHDYEYDEHGYPDDEHGYGEQHPLDAPATRMSRRADRHVRKKRKTGRAVKRLLVFVVAIALIGAAAFAAVTVLKPVFSGFGGDTDYAGPGSGDVQVTVNPGDSGRAIAQTLFTAGVVKTAKAFTDAASDNPASAGIQPGEYTLKKEMKASDAVAYLANPANRSVPMVTVPEGRWKSEVFAILAKASGLPVADYENAAKDAAALGLPASAKGNVEGYLFPATYELAKSSTPTEQLRQMVQKSVATLTTQGVAPEDMEKVVTTASILEAEGRSTEDREKQARVILNRLSKNMNLQLDSTVSYGVQKRAVTTTDAERADKNPYNTYVNAGLPAGPIGNPSAASIEAALHPADGPWLFWVTVNPSTGETKFAETQDQHDQFVKEFQAWCQANTGKC